MPIKSFPPVVSKNATLLILGSMPGVTSLKLQQYYGYPHNAFWPIMGEICGAGLELAYAERLQQLRETGIALWDVLRQCEREGSLDSSIDQASEEPNALVELLSEHTGIHCVFFNGHKAEQAFHKHVLPVLPESVRLRLTLTRLPSTSPANARLSQNEKLVIWRQAIEPCLAKNRPK
jgi:TDG/mug DNA glycosylase family protein